MVDHAAVVRIARNQHGLITREQALRSDATARQIQRLVRVGSWDRMYDGVFSVGAAPVTWKQRVLAACMAAGDDAIASHRTAARLREVVDRSGRIELLTDGYRRVRIPGPLVRRTIHLADLAYPPPWIAIELDGWETHGIRSAFEPDRIRGNDLLLLGWNLYRFTWSMSDDYICTTIDQALARHQVTNRP